MPCTQTDHAKLKANAVAFAAGTKYLGPCDGGIMGACLLCNSTLVLEFDMNDGDTLPDTATLRREGRTCR